MKDQKHRVLTPVHSLDDIPAFASERDEAEYWDRHTFGPALLARMKPAHPQKQPARRQRAKPITIRLDTAVLTRLRGLAARRGIGYQTLLKQLVARGIAEEEQSVCGADQEAAVSAHPSRQEQRGVPPATHP
jgi:uncharacterized protein (DUF4415 family)